MRWNVIGEVGKEKTSPHLGFLQQPGLVCDVDARDVRNEGRG